MQEYAQTLSIDFGSAYVERRDFSQSAGINSAGIQ
jgi:hypothetical protein